MTTVGCVLCGLKMDGDDFENHMAEKHQEFQRDWHPPKEAHEMSEYGTLKQSPTGKDVGKDGK